MDNPYTALAEAIYRGVRETYPCKDWPFFYEGSAVRACVIGAAAVGVGIEPNDTLGTGEVLDLLQGKGMPVYEVLSPLTLATYFDDVSFTPRYGQQDEDDIHICLADVLVELNDTEGWTRPEIADFVASLAE